MAYFWNMPTTTELTEKYIEEHVSIKDCLKKDIINYSALSRLIAKELNIEKKTSKEAILIAARRLKEKLKNKSLEDAVIRLFRNSNIDIKNNIVVLTLEKKTYPEALIELENEIKRDNSLFFSIEGTKTITLIIQQEYEKTAEKKFKNNILKKKNRLSLFTITSKGIESTPGAVAYLAGLFFENNVNMAEFMSCHDDTLVVVESQDIEKAIRFLKF